MSDQPVLRGALLKVQRGLSVAKLGLSRDGVQHAKIVQMEAVVAEALFKDGAALAIASRPTMVEVKNDAHTPGEWVADRDCYYGKQPRVHSGDLLICVVGNSQTSRQDQWEADAALIAAAPDLLEAARLALNYIENTESELGITLGSGDALREAISKTPPNLPSASQEGGE